MMKAYGLTIKVLFKSSIMHELVNQHVSPVFLAISKELYQIPVMYS